MIHPWKKIIEEIRNRNWTQKQFAILVWKKNSEVNELIKWKRNITIQWDYILSQVLWTPEKYWINMQTDYDYEQMKLKLKEEKQNKPEFEVVEDIPSNNIQEVSDIQEKKENIGRPHEEIEENNEWGKMSSFVKEVAPDLSGDEGFKMNISTDSSKWQSKNEISEEEKQNRKEMKKVFINF